MGRFVGSKQQQRWLWHAIDNQTGGVLAYVSSGHEDSAFLELKVLLEPFGITQFYPDGWGADERHVKPMFHAVGEALDLSLDCLFSHPSTGSEHDHIRMICKYACNETNES